MHGLFALQFISQFYSTAKINTTVSIQRSRLSHAVSPEGGVDFDQFCQVTRILERTPADEKLALSAAFKVFDKSGDGMISRSHLAEVLKTKGADQLTDEEIEGMLAQVTRDGNVAYEGKVAPSGG